MRVVPVVCLPRALYQSPGGVLWASSIASVMSKKLFRSVVSGTNLGRSEGSLPALLGAAGWEGSKSSSFKLAFRRAIDLVREPGVVV